MARPTAGNSQDTSDASKQGYSWSRCHGTINSVADNFFYRLGFWVASHPKLTLLTSLVLVGACCSGFANFRVETDGGEYALILMERSSETGSVLTKAAMDVLWELDAIVKAVETDGKTYADLCAKDLDEVTCELPFRGVTRFWNNDVTIYEASVTNDADVLTAVNVEVFPDGEDVNHQALFGNSLVYDDAGLISGAGAMIQGYGLADDPEDDQFNDDVFAWNGEFQDVMEELKGNFADVVRMLYLTSRSLDDGFEESISGEIFLFAVTFMVMIVFVMVAIGRCCAGLVRRRTWLGLAGVMLVLAAIMAAYGLNSAFGVPFTALSQILPFILVAIGVDDIFVIVAAFDHTDPSLPVEERIALGTKRCGVSITYTSLTNFFAFLLGSVSSLPAMTAFVALLTMDANRQKAGRMEWCCCFTSKRYLQEVGTPRDVTLPAAQLGASKESGNDDDHGNGRGVRVHDLKNGVNELSAIGKFIRDKYSPLLLSSKGKALVLLGATALLAAGIYGATKASLGFDSLDLAPDDHYSRTYTALARRYEVDVDEWFLPLKVYTMEVDYADVAVQAQILATDELMLEQEFAAGPIESWLISFVQWAENSTDYSANVGTSGGYQVYDDPATFYTALSEFTEDGVNARFLADVIFDDDGTIKICRSGMFLVDQTDTSKQIDALKDTRDVIDQSTLDPEPFGFYEGFVSTEQDLVIYGELLSSFLLALAAVLVLSFFVLGKIAVVLLVVASVAIIDVELLGFVYHWNLQINSITVIELIMAVGLVVDYMAHLVHYFLHQDPNASKDKRIADALGEIGPSILLGTTTTFMGIVPLAFANNVIFRTFFKMFLCIISFGFFHGVVFIPVVLSILPDRLVSKPAAVAGTDRNIQVERTLAVDDQTCSP
eukprot:g4312.t1